MIRKNDHRPTPQPTAAIGRMELLEPRQLLSTVSVSTGTQYQTVEGFGASIKSWVHDDTYYSEAFWDKMVGDLGANMIRGAVWPTFEKANDNNDPNTFNWEKFDSGALAHVMGLFQEMDQRTPDAKFNLTVWTGPWWMKTTQSHKDGGALRADMKEEFAEYLAAVVISAKRDYGIDVDFLSIQNEPVFTLDYESMTMDPWQIRETIRAVNRRFKAEGLKTELLIADDLLTPIRFRWLTEPTMNDPETRNFQGHFSIHGYASSQNWRGVRDVIESYDPDKALQMTEGSGEPNDWGGAMTLAYTMRQALEEGNSTSFHYWQFTDPSGPNALTHDGKDNVKTPVFQQFARYVRPGMKHVKSASDDSRILPVSFRDPKTGNVTIVLINNSHDAVDVDVNISGADLPGGYKVVRTTQDSYVQSLGTLDGKTGLDITMPGKSIITLYTGQKAQVTAGAGAPSKKAIQPLWDPSNATPIHQNAFRGTAASTQKRLDAGDDPNAVSGNGWTPLHAAAASTWDHSLDIIDTLIAAGAKINAKTSNDGLTPLHVAAMSSTVQWPIDQELVVKRLKKLVDHGANVNAKDTLGRTPLHWAAMTGKIFIPATGPRLQQNDMVKQLIALGADVNAKDDAGNTAADYAALYDYDSIVKALTDAGATPPKDPNPPPPPPPDEPGNPGDPDDNLPAGWTSSDIGVISLPGSSQHDKGVFTIKGAGRGLRGASDDFRFVHQDFSGDGRIIVNLKSVEQTDAFGVGGIMFRETTDAGSKMAALTVNGAGSLVRTVRTADGDAAISEEVGNVKLQHWLRIIRDGDTFRFAVSNDGGGWNNVGTANVSMQANVAVGLAVAAGNDSQRNTSVFSDVSISDDPTGPGNNPGPGNGTVVLAPESDAYVRRATHKNKNFGKKEKLLVKNGKKDPADRKIYLRFDLSDLSENFDGAKLRLFGRQRGNGPAVATKIFGGPGTTWDDDTITWKKKPKVNESNKLASKKVKSSKAQWYEWDLTEYLKQLKADGHDSVTLVVKQSKQVKPYTWFHSGDAGNSKGPELVIT